MSLAAAPSTVWAISDLHVGHADNKAVLESLRPVGEQDWLLVVGDVADRVDDIAWALRLLTDRFRRVVWVPGNHELWTTQRGDGAGLRGQARYDHLVALCRSLGVLTPEDPYPVWRGPDGPVTVAPLFLLYDYTFRPAGTSTKEEALAYAHSTGVVCSDEFLLHPDPHAGIDDWCRERVAVTERRLAAVTNPVVLVNHWPLVRTPTDVLRYPEFAQWCGTELTADWHTRFGAVAMVYGHLHIPRTTHYDGVRFEEVSLGYPREWKRRSAQPGVLRQILPPPP
ncbi:metallophosphoesterase [Rhodococcus sp. X156]|uniref:metallophosphoesterase family protein n=1 Tax=Rhodococcus sp. X156 TaxID=2499145 RepID=UPI001F49ADFE|nr:metallophosphoesterase [Rhodococcus sp. X156]